MILAFGNSFLMRLIASVPFKVRHLNIHQSHVRSVPSKLFDGFLSVGRLRYDFHIGLSLYQGRDPFAQQGMIINGEDPNQVRIGTHESSAYEQPKSSATPRFFIGVVAERQSNFRTRWLRSKIQSSSDSTRRS
jgi:hypothetical protein